MLLKVDMLCSHEYFAKGDAETVDARDDREVQPPLKIWINMNISFSV